MAHCYSSPPLLTSVLVVCREVEQLDALAHVASTIDAFLDRSQQISIARACILPSLALVKRIVARYIHEDPMLRQWQFSTGLPNAIAAEDLELVKYLVEHFHDCEVPARAVGRAAIHGRLEILKWLKSHGCKLRAIDADVEKALKADHEETAIWLNDLVVEHGAASPSRGSWTSAAAQAGNLRMMHWSMAADNRTSRSYRYAIPGRGDSAKRAAMVGHVGILEWLLNQTDMALSIGLEYCAAGGHLMLMKWLYCHYKNNCILEGALLAAARSGQLPTVQWLHETFNGSRDHGVSALECMNEAAGNGHLDVVKWLHVNRFEGCSHRAMDLAAKGGFLVTVEWLHANCFSGCSSSAIDGAAAGGHLAVVQWLHLNTFEGCTSAAMDGAAANGHLEVVKWLHASRSEGCTSKAMNGAAMAGHLSVVKWLHIHRTEGCTVDAMNSAASGGHLDVVQWLHYNRVEGCTAGAMNGAAARGHLGVVRWLLLNRSEGCTVDAMDNAAGSGHFDVVLFLHRERTEGCSARAKEKLSRNRHDEYFSWFQENYPVQFRASNVTPYEFNQALREFMVHQRSMALTGQGR